MWCSSYLHYLEFLWLILYTVASSKIVMLLTTSILDACFLAIYRPGKSD